MHVQVRLSNLIHETNSVILMSLTQTNCPKNGLKFFVKISTATVTRSLTIHVYIVFAHIL
jgi:hypothetical protein